MLITKVMNRIHICKFTYHKCVIYNIKLKYSYVSGSRIYIA